MRTKDLLKILVLLTIGLLIPRIMLFYVVCGVLDFRRSNRLEFANWKRYFLGNGIFTWVLSPFNLLLDVLSYKNKYVYYLNDLPEVCQAEIATVIKIAQESPQIITELNKQMDDKARGMIFFKWYGKNCKTSLVIPEFNQEFTYIRTIGVSIFNKNKSTSIHYGPLRVTLRVLYNLVPRHDDRVYIQAGHTKHYWHDNPLFIFDDTLVHQSNNGSDELRYCMFIDILRPSRHLTFLDAVLKVVRFITKSYNMVFYQNWKMIK